MMSKLLDSAEIGLFFEEVDKKVRTKRLTGGKLTEVEKAERRLIDDFHEVMRLYNLEVLEKAEKRLAEKKKELIRP